MVNMFGKAKEPDLPKVPPPAPIPEAQDPKDALARQKKRGGFRETVITGGLTPETGKKRLLG